MREELSSTRGTKGRGGGMYGSPTATSVARGGANVLYVPIERRCACGNLLSGYNLEVSCEQCLKKRRLAEVAPRPKGGSIVPEVRERLLTHTDFSDYYGYYRSLGWSSKSVDSALSAAKRYFARRGSRLVGQRGRGHRLELEES